MKPISKHEWQKQQFAEALKRFEHHTIVERTEWSWLVRGKSSNLWFEVTVRNGRIVVDGDVDVVGFLGGDGWKDPAKYVEWIGRHVSDLDYPAGKAAQWWGDTLTEREAEVALSDLAWMIERQDEDLGPVEEDEDDEFTQVRAAVKRIDDGESFDDVEHSGDGSRVARKGRWVSWLQDRGTLREAMSKVSSGEHDGLELLPHWLYEELKEPDTEVLGGIGSVIARRVIVGVAACVHLHRLLEAEKTAASAPEGTDGR